MREAGISLIGFFENNPDYAPDEVFILDYGIHPVNKQRLDGIAERYGKRITYLDAKPVTAQMKRDFPHLKGWRGTMAPTAKAFVDMIVPDYVERLLFIDADTVVAGSLAQLYDLDMGDAALAVVPASMDESDFKKGKVRLANGNQMYFNSGVLLFDMNNWCRENCHQMVMDALHLELDLEWPDQTLLNNAIPQRIIKLLPPKFNYLTHYFHPHQERCWLRKGHHHTEEEITEAINHPAIIHYLGGWIMARPWYEGCCSTHADEYFRYKALSPWKDSPLSKSNAVTNPPKDFRTKLSLWQMQQYSRRRSYHVTLITDAISRALFSLMDKVEKKKGKMKKINQQ